MNIRKTYDNVMHFLVHNSILFTVIIMCLVHATLLTMVWAGEAQALIVTNTISVIVYLFCILLCKDGHVMPVYVSILLEVGIYAALSSYFIGWNSGGYFFLFAIVPIIIYLGCFIFKGVKRWIIAISLTAIFAEFVCLYLKCSVSEPVYDLNNGIRVALMVFSSFVMFFGVVFYNTIYIYSSEHEVISLEERNEQLTADAKIDALTELLNRRGFMPLLEQIMQGKAEDKFCIAFADIDNFKRVNDTYGHECGDEVLMHISRMIKREMTGCDVCRWGGEEIVILMKDCDIEEARTKMETVRKLVESTPTVFYNVRIPVTVTIGLTENVEKYGSPDDLIKVADARMYYGKQHGKNIVVSEDAGEAK
ncbi:MAG: GGDEF domain-containing protein [Lachnospiraceae bacterium]|nr:GGDEF domain-containing protein [Lachnospiraceae bacterium]